MKKLLIVLQLVSLGMFAQNEAVTFKKQADKSEIAFFWQTARNGAGR